MLSAALRTYDQLGPEPPRINLAQNDHDNSTAHTIARHGPDVPLRRDPDVQTIEGRIYKDTGWRRPENQSFRWDSPAVMTREINRYVRQNWEAIRSDLALGGRHEDYFTSDNRVGEGFLNGGMYGTGPRQAHYMVTKLMLIRIELVPNSDPAKAFVVSAFPAGILR
ncbi:hypothetical protein [Actinoplanes sp. M2I2]|uniref:hypothetical protein n=1 Tax=Actinoplanes sp. M2I2 TaxID=1734444 RepID=UPI002020874B|nr:hypothetical protein [Actinoplanes sp. M2I2]